MNFYLVQSVSFWASSTLGQAIPLSQQGLLKSFNPLCGISLRLPVVISASVIPRSHADLQPVQNALEALSRTDPSARNDVQEGQLLIHGLGALHLEIVEGRLRDEWKVNFEFGRRYVSYRESLGPNNPTENWNVWETEIGGKSVKITMSITIRPLEPEDPIASFNSKHYADGEPKRSVNGNRKRGTRSSGRGKSCTSAQARRSSTTPLSVRWAAESRDVALGYSSCLARTGRRA